jgi:nucleoid-associated protein YgaU
MGNELQKAKIVVLDPESGSETGQELVLMYNPESLAYTRAPTIQPKDVPGKELAEQHRAGGGKATLTLNKITFDTTRAMTMATDGVDVTAGADVRTYTKFFADLLTEKSAGKPPYCRFEWGKKIYIVKGLLTQFSVNYLMFKPDGTPIRSEVNITLEEQATLTEQDKLWQNPTSRSVARKVWVVRQGERLDYIAYKEYGDSRRWRDIALLNQLEDPFSLRPGQVLKLIPAE